MDLETTPKKDQLPTTLFISYLSDNTLLNPDSILA